MLLAEEDIFLPELLKYEAAAVFDLKQSVHSQKCNPQQDADKTCSDDWCQTVRW